MGNIVRNGNCFKRMIFWGLASRWLELVSPLEVFLPKMFCKGHPPRQRCVINSFFSFRAHQKSYFYKSFFFFIHTLGLFKGWRRAMALGSFLRAKLTGSSLIFSSRAIFLWKEECVYNDSPESFSQETRVSTLKSVRLAFDEFRATTKVSHIAEENDRVERHLN